MAAAGSAHDGVVPRLGDVSAALLALALLAFGLVADRGLVAQVAAIHDKSVAAAEAAARLTTASVRAALGALEEQVLGGRSLPGVLVERLAVPPEPSVAPPASLPYGRRPRSELTALLQSTAVTANGLPEAVLARIALGPAGIVSSSEEPAPDVAERLLRGELPVRIEDLSYLARALGVSDDFRVRVLEARLRRAPEVTGLPEAPAFRRVLTPGQTVESWCRKGGLRIRYGVSLAALLRRAGVHGSARPAAAGGGDRTVSVSDVVGLELTVVGEGNEELRVRALRWALWAAVATSLFGLVAVRRAFAREARATTREKAFVAGVTHELRTPLAAIRLLAETLADGRGHPREYGALVAQETERLESLVERVLSVARVDEAPRFAEARPAEIVRSAVALLAPRAERRAVTLESAVDDLPTATWDGEAVRQALVNLVENAIRHGREGGHVMVRGVAEGSTVRLSVRDDGPGISRHDRRSVFDRFVRGRAAGSGTGTGTGTGLGLYLVEQVARAHGGRVDLETEEGRGSTFTLVLPFVPPMVQGTLA
jgi:signal transduction histidine kinase